MSEEVIVTSDAASRSRMENVAAAEDLSGLPNRAVVVHGLQEGFSGFLDLAKVIVPVYFAVALLNYFGAIGLLAHWLKPVMKVFGLPGEAAVVLMTGYFLSIYGAMGALKALALPNTAITAIGFMLLFAHALPVEWAILQKMGARAWRITFMRLGLSILGGLIYALLHRGQVPQAAAVISPESLPFALFLGQTALGCVKLLALIFVIILPVTVISALARARDVMPKLARRIHFLAGRFGVGETAVAPLLVGIIFGIVYGGGALIAMARAGVVKQEEARTVGTFLGICHSVFEDPVLFVLIGGNWVWLWLVRFLTAVALTPLLRRWI